MRLIQKIARKRDISWWIESLLVEWYALFTIPKYPRKLRDTLVLKKLANTFFSKQGHDYQQRASSISPKSDLSREELPREELLREPPREELLRVPWGLPRELPRAELLREELPRELPREELPREELPRELLRELAKEGLPREDTLVEPQIEHSLIRASTSSWRNVQTEHDLEQRKV